MVDVETGAAVPLPVLPGGLGPTQSAPLGGSVRFSPDGKWLYATGKRVDGKRCSTDAPCRGGNWEPVRLDGLATITSFDVTPDGRELVISDEAPHEARSALSGVAADGGLPNNCLSQPTAAVSLARKKATCWRS